MSKLLAIIVLALTSCGKTTAFVGAAKRVESAPENVNANQVAAPVAVAITTTRNLSKIEVSPKEQTTLVGGTATFTALAIYDDNTTEDITGTADWSGSSEFLEMIEKKSSGFTVKATAVSTGTPITASHQGKTASANLIIVQPSSYKLSIEPLYQETIVGNTVKFNAYLADENGQRKSDVSSVVSWQVGDTTKATLGRAGSITGIAAVSNMLVRAEYKDSAMPSSPLLAEARFTVKARNATALIVTPNPQTVNVGSDAQFRAVVRFDDNSQEDLTTSATWTSSNNAVAEPRGNAPGAYSTKVASTGLDVSASLSIDGRTLQSTSRLIINTVMQPALPVADLQVNNQDADHSVAYNSPISIAWSSANADMCSVSPYNFSGIQGNVANAGQATGTSMTVVLTCTNSTGSATDTIRLTVLPPPASIAISANNIVSPSAASVPYDGSVTIRWAIQNATNCSINHGIGAVTATGSRLHANLQANRTYTLSCLDLQSRAITSSVNVNVAGPALPTAQLFANGLRNWILVRDDWNVNLSWTVADSTSCELVSDIFAGGKLSIAPASGNRNLGQLTSDKVVTLSCANGPALLAQSEVRILVLKAEVTANGVTNELTVLRNSDVNFAFQASNTSSCNFEFQSDDDGVNYNIPLPTLAPITRTQGFWTKGYFLNCSGANSDGATVSLRKPLIVRSVGLEVSLNDSPGNIQITPNQPVVVSYRAPEWTSCELQDTATNARYALTPSWGFQTLTINNINSWRGLITRCQKGSLSAESALQVMVTSPSSPPVTPHHVTAVSLGVERGAGVPQQAISRFDNNWEVCLSTSGLVTANALSGRSEVPRILDLNFHVSYLDGTKAVFKMQRTGSSGTFQIGNVADWTGVTTVGGNGGVNIWKTGRMEPGPMLPTVRSHKNNASIGLHCLRVADDHMDQTGFGYVTANFNIVR